MLSNEAMMYSQSHLKKLLQERLSNHVKNLAQWSEGRYCALCKGTGKLSLTQNTPDLLSERPTCPLCNGKMIEPGTQGFLLPTEPDSEERRRIRAGLRSAIDEIQNIADLLAIKLEPVTERQNVREQV